MRSMFPFCVRCRRSVMPEPHAQARATGNDGSRAHPYFVGGWHAAENACRGYYAFLPPSVGYYNGAPPWWYDGGMGWSTTYFMDLESFDASAQHPGVHRCLVPSSSGRPCKFVVTGGEAFVCGRWFPLAKAPKLMARHLVEGHDLHPPPKRSWATSINEDSVFCMGCTDAVCCCCFQLSRQYASLHGYKATPAGYRYCCYACACPCCAAHELRSAVVRLHNIDERPCKTCACAFLCFPCSVCATYREFAAAGLWPGGACERYEPQLVLGDVIEEGPVSQPNKW